MSRFDLLLACIRSGQMGEAQIAAEMRDPLFRAYWRKVMRPADAAKGVAK